MLILNKKVADAAERTKLNNLGLKHSYKQE